DGCDRVVVRLCQHRLCSLGLELLETVQLRAQQLHRPPHRLRQLAEPILPPLYLENLLAWTVDPSPPKQTFQPVLLPDHIPCQQRVGPRQLAQFGELLRCFVSYPPQASGPQPLGQAMSIETVALGPLFGLRPDRDHLRDMWRESLVQPQAPLSLFHTDVQSARLLLQEAHQSLTVGFHHLSPDLLARLAEDTEGTAPSMNVQSKVSFHRRLPPWGVDEWVSNTT